MSRGKTRESEVILGIDPGLADTGWGMVEKVQSSVPLRQVAEEATRFKVQGYGVVKTPASQPDAERLSRIHAEIRRLIKEHKPNRIAIEMLFFGKNAKTAMQVGQARGVTLLAATTSGALVEEFTPLQVKIALTGYGRADKKQIQEMVKRLLKLDKIPKPDDAADALAVALTAGVTSKIP